MTMSDSPRLVISTFFVQFLLQKNRSSYNNRQSFVGFKALSAYAPGFKELLSAEETLESVSVGFGVQGAQKER